MLRDMPDKSVDAVITDPPYGIADVWKGGRSEKHGWGNARITDGKRTDGI